MRTMYTEANILTAVQYGAYEVRFWINTTLESLYLKAPGLPRMPIGPLEEYAKVVAIWDRVN